MFRFLLSTCVALTVLPMQAEAQVRTDERSGGAAVASRATLNVKRLVEQGDVEALAKFHRANPKDERFRTLESDIEAAPLVEMNMMGMRSFSKLSDPTEPTPVERDSAKVLITVHGSQQISQARALKDAVRWKLVESKDLGVARITESSTNLLAAGGTRSAHMVEVRALAPRFRAKIVLFSSRPTDGVEISDLIVNVIGAQPQK